MRRTRIRRGAVSSAGRAPPSHGGGHRFKSCTAHHPKNGAVVKSVITPACHAGGRGFESLPLRQKSPGGQITDLPFLHFIAPAQFSGPPATAGGPVGFQDRILPAPARLWSGRMQHSTMRLRLPGSMHLHFFCRTLRRRRPEFQRSSAQTWAAIPDSGGYFLTQLRSFRYGSGQPRAVS